MDPGWWQGCRGKCLVTPEFLMPYLGMAVGRTEKIGDGRRVLEIAYEVTLEPRRTSDIGEAQDPSRGNRPDLRRDGRRTR